MILTTGKSRSGKTSLTLLSAAAEPRLIVFDYPGRDWPQSNCERIEGIRALTTRLLEVRDGPVRISYRPSTLSSAEFGQWAQASLAWSHFAPACFIAEELADVVHAGKAPAGWGELVRGGLAYGNTIHGITQRVQETDKSIFGNATTLRIFRANTRDDEAYIARASGIPVADIAGLKRLEYLEKNNDSGEVKTLKLPKRH